MTAITREEWAAAFGVTPEPPTAAADAWAMVCWAWKLKPWGSPWDCNHIVVRLLLRGALRILVANGSRKVRAEARELLAQVEFVR